MGKQICKPRVYKIINNIYKLRMFSLNVQEDNLKPRGKMTFKKGNDYWKLRKNQGFPKGKKNPKLSKKRKEMFTNGDINLSNGNNGMYGKTHSKEAKNKVSEANKGKNHPFYGKKQSEETKRKISQAHKGKKLSEKHKNKIGLKKDKNPMWGKTHPKESKKKIIEKRKNQKNTYTTSIELKIQKYLKNLRIDFFTHQYMNIGHGYQCDIFIPSKNLVIECDGDYWHSYPTGKEIDHIRTSELTQKGFKVLRLWENEINKMNLEEFKLKLGGIKDVS